MAGSINISRAKNELFDESFFISAALVVVGSLLSSLATTWMRDNVYDVQMTGGDAIYPIIAAFLVMVVAPKNIGKPIALGATASSVRVAAKQFGLI
jgi:hypothetical protein